MQSDNSRSTAGQSALFGLLSSVWLFLLQPHIAVRDVDGYAYIMGARSLLAGHGYKSLSGEAFNHWPPGYSFILSGLGGSFTAAMLLNCVSFGLTVAFLYALLRRAQWSWQCAAGLTLVLTTGFFRLMASAVHADILTYAIFLGAILALTSENGYLGGPGLALALLVPVKLIAAIFVFPAIVADFVAGLRLGPLLRKYAPGIAVTLAGVAVILIFNQTTLGEWIPASHQKTSLASLIANVKGAVISIPRSFLFGWHGGTGTRPVRALFGTSMILALICLASLRPAPLSRWFRTYGLFCLLASGLLLGVRSFDPSVRLTGYGLLVLMAGFKPQRWSQPVWLAYGLLAFFAGTWNGTTVNSLGANDPRYIKLAGDFSSNDKPTGVVATNSFHILDMHAGVASEPITDDRAAGAYSELFWVTLPSFDPGSSPVTPMPRPGADWCEVRQLEGGVIFRRCTGKKTAVTSLE